MLSLTAGDKLGPYEILGPLGQGGMGEVYRARDSRLKRDVALKVLPESFAHDSGRMARFQREAEVLASLNHPNIAHIYGIEERALVMELVEGESPKGPLPFDDAWKIAAQIADALDYAHERGVIHRDLKPANVKVTPDGVVKLLDFGLAKALSDTPDSVGSDPSNSPTLTMGATVAGVILGTAAYMAPEQAKGKKVDKRADIWSWGVMLYELLTGERIFEGEDVTETLAAVIHKQPELESVPPKVRRLLRDCLQKDPKHRLRDIGDAGRMLEGPAPNPRSAARPSVLPWSVAGLCASVALAAALWIWLKQPAPLMQSLRYTIEAPPDLRFTSSYFATALSPDGRMLVFAAVRSGRAVTVGESSLWLRAMDSISVRELPGTGGGNGMFWSPDGKSIGFVASGKLKRIDVVGGAPQVLCDAPTYDGGSWSQDGTILFSSGNVIQRVPASGGTPVPVTTLDGSRLETAHRSPYLLPNGKRFLFTILSNDANRQGIYVAMVDQPNQRTRLAGSDAKALYAPPYAGHPGYLLWLRDQTLMAQPFDGKSHVQGDPSPIADAVSQNGVNLRAAFWISDNGLLLYRSGGDNLEMKLSWITRDGKREMLEPGAAGAFGSPALSPDGARVAFGKNATGSTLDIWVYEFARRATTRLTFGPGTNNNAVWSPDGRQIVFSSDRGGVTQLYRKDSGGTGQEERLTEGPNPKIPTDWSRDGRYILYEERDPKSNLDVWALPVQTDRGQDSRPIPVLRTSFSESHAQFSPDGKWIAYQSDELGNVPAIYLQPFPPSGGKWQVSPGAGVQPRWRGDGKEIYYNFNGSMWAVGIRISAGRIEIDPPRALFAHLFINGPEYIYDVARDGQRFLEFQPPAADNDQSANALTVVSNWQAALKQ
jgi:eukaryotic-like serine/threonine-protein kinase